jgi:hypothetical protein
MYDDEHPGDTADPVPTRRWSHPDDDYFLIDAAGWAVPFEHFTEREPVLSARRRRVGRRTSVPRWAAAFAGSIVIALAPSSVVFGQEDAAAPDVTPSSGPIDAERSPDGQIDWTPELAAEVADRRAAHDALADGSLDGIGYLDSYGVGEGADDRVDPPEYVDVFDSTHVSRRGQISEGLGAVRQANPGLGSRFAVVGSSGATTADVYAAQPEDADDPAAGARNHPMADVAPSGDVDFLAFSLGGNDAGFADLVDLLARDGIDRAEFDQFLDDSGFGATVAPLTEEDLGALASRPLDPNARHLAERLAAVMRDRVLANPTAIPMISTYPEAIDPNAPLDGWVVDLTAEELTFFLEHARNLNSAVRAAAALCDCGALVVEQAGALEGREFNTPDPAIAGIDVPEQLAQGLEHRDQEAVHPNLQGTDLLGDTWGQSFADAFDLNPPDPDVPVDADALPDLYVPERPPEGVMPVPSPAPRIDFERDEPVADPVAFTPEPVPAPVAPPVVVVIPAPTEPVVEASPPAAERSEPGEGAPTQNPTDPPPPLPPTPTPPPAAPAQEDTALPAGDGQPPAPGSDETSEGDVDPALGGTSDAGTPSGDASPEVPADDPSPDAHGAQPGDDIVRPDDDDDQDDDDQDDDDQDDQESDDQESDDQESDDQDGPVADVDDDVPEPPSDRPSNDDWDGPPPAESSNDSDRDDRDRDDRDRDDPAPAPQRDNEQRPSQPAPPSAPDRPSANDDNEPLRSSPRPEPRPDRPEAPPSPDRAPPSPDRAPPSLPSPPSPDRAPTLPSPDRPPSPDRAPPSLPSPPSPDRAPPSPDRAPPSPAHDSWFGA